VTGDPPLLAGGDHVNRAPLHWLPTAGSRGADGGLAFTVVVVVGATVVVVVGGLVVVVGATVVVVVGGLVVVVVEATVVDEGDVVDVDTAPPKAPRPFGVPIPVGPSYPVPAVQR